MPFFWLAPPYHKQTDVYNWVFLYLGADQDAIKVAESYGIAANKAVNYDKGMAAKAGGILSKKLQMMSIKRRAEVQGIEFDEDDQEELKKKK